MADDSIVRVPWPEFRARLRWAQGEHVGLVGPTGQGKTTLALDLLGLRGWSVILATKPRDRTLAGLERTGGYHRISAWPPPNDRTPRVLLWPRWRSPADTPRQAAAIHHALTSIFGEEAWCVFADDVQYLTDRLRLGSVLTDLWLQARALRVSVVAATQRPRHVPLVMWSQSSHLFLWGTNDDEDLRRLSGFGGLSSKRIRTTVAGLARHDVLYINTRTGALAVTRYERPTP